MSEILIRRMEMPKNCKQCFYMASGCKANKHNNGRPQDCPLIAIQPHGRLIDADELEDSFEPSDFWNPEAEDNCFAAIRIVHSAPTIIEAEPPESEGKQ